MARKLNIEWCEISVNTKEMAILWVNFRVTESYMEALQCVYVLFVCVGLIFGDSFAKQVF